jgi:hypothetical protein
MAMLPSPYGQDPDGEVAQAGSRIYAGQRIRVKGHGPAKGLVSLVLQR